ncbi:hypothetical protein PS2_018825 [Malus domestica]
MKTQPRTFTKFTMPVPLIYEVTKYELWLERPPLLKSNPQKMTFTLLFVSCGVCHYRDMLEMENLPQEIAKEEKVDKFITRNAMKQIEKRDDEKPPQHKVILVNIIFDESKYLGYTSKKRKKKTQEALNVSHNKNLK